MKRSIVVMVFAALLAGAGTARAVTSAGTAASAPAVPPGRYLREQAGAWSAGPAHRTAIGDSLGLKSPGTAARISLAGTLLPFLVGLPLTGDEESGSVIGGSLALAGIVVGPSLGYFYGGCGRRGLIGLGVRVGLLAITGIAASQAEWPTVGIMGPGEEGNAAAGITILAGSALMVVSVVDLFRVSGTVSDANDRRVREAATITPTIGMLTGSDGVAVGVKVRF